MEQQLTWCPEMIETLTTMRRGGASFSACAQRIGVGYTTARKQARKLGLSTTPQPCPTIIKHHGTPTLRRRNAQGRWV